VTAEAEEQRKVSKGVDIIDVAVNVLVLLVVVAMPMLVIWRLLEAMQQNPVQDNVFEL